MSCLEISLFIPLSLKYCANTGAEIPWFVPINLCPPPGTSIQFPVSFLSLEYPASTVLTKCCALSKLAKFGFFFSASLSISSGIDS